MAGEITKLTFKHNADLQVEVVPLDTLVKANKHHVIIPHRTNFYHIFLFENCWPVHMVDFVPVNIQPWSLLFIDKDRVHQFDPSLQYDGQLLIFTDRFFCISDGDTKFLRSSVLFNNLSNSSAINLEKATFQKFLAVCQNIKDELALPADTSTHILLKNHMQNFLLLAEREKRKQGFSGPEKSPDLDYTLLFLDLLEKNYTKLKTVGDYTPQLHISEKRLGQATKKVLGKPPKEIINDRLLLEAKRLLVYTNLSIKETGQALGFDDPAYFVRYFKKNTATTPVEFRGKYIKK